MNSGPHIYFCGSIRGGRELAGRYEELITLTNRFGSVFTEHVGNEEQIEDDNRSLTDREIHDRDMAWIERSDLVIAEVTVPSLGVGYEIARAVSAGKPVLCLYDYGSGGNLSAMIAGCQDVTVFRYTQVSEIEPVLQRFIVQHAERHTP